MIKKYSSKFYSSVDQRANNSATSILAIFSKLFPLSGIERAMDVGCGSGAWLNELLEKSNAKVTGFDLPESIEINRKRLGAHTGKRLSLQIIDFEKASSLPNLDSDLGICLEVLEHLSPVTGIRIVDWLSQNCNLVIFSAATPGQGGTGHINEQPHSFWLEKFEHNGFMIFDCFRPTLQSDKNCARYYSLNAFLLVKKGSSFASKIKLQPINLNLSDPIDYRTRLEKIQFAILKTLNYRLVTLLSKIASR